MHALTEVMSNFSVQQDVLIGCRLAAQKHCCVLELELLTQPAHIYSPLARVTRSPDRLLNLKIQEGHRVNKKPEQRLLFHASTERGIQVILWHSWIPITIHVTQAATFRNFFFL